MRNILMLTFALIFTLQIFAQTDSLKGLPLPRVMDLIYQQRDSSKAVSISNYLTNRARIEKDSSAVSWGHYGNYLYRRPPLNLPFLDSLIYSTKGLNNSEEIFGLISNGDYHFLNNNDFISALNFYVRARRLSVTLNKEYNIKYTTNAIASIKFLGREFTEALALYHRYGQLHSDDMLGLYFNIANCHYELKNIDSLSYYSKIGIQKSLIVNDTLNYGSFLRLNGVSQYLHGNYKRALDSLQKSRSLTTDSIDLGSSYYYTALAHERMGNSDSAVYYLKEISLLDQEPEIKNVYFKLYENAKKHNWGDEQLTYLEKYIEMDSFLQSKSKGLISRIDSDYNLPLFLERRKQLRNAQDATSNLTYVVIALSILFITSIIFSVSRYVLQKKRVKEAIGNPENYLKTVDIPNFKGVIKKNTLPIELIEQFDKFFIKFEADKHYLDSTMSLQTLSAAANTNTSYLSSYLNTHKGGYSNYINSLRSQYAFNSMPKDPKILIFTLDHIAKLYGFTSLRAFNRSFVKFLKIKPSDYLAQIKKRK